MTILGKYGYNNNHFLQNNVQLSLKTSDPLKWFWINSNCCGNNYLTNEFQNTLKK